MSLLLLLLSVLAGCAGRRRQASNGPRVPAPPPRAAEDVLTSFWSSVEALALEGGQTLRVLKTTDVSATGFENERIHLLTAELDAEDGAGLSWSAHAEEPFMLTDRALIRVQYDAYQSIDRQPAFVSGHALRDGRLLWELALHTRIPAPVRTRFGSSRLAMQRMDRSEFRVLSTGSRPVWIWYIDHQRGVITRSHALRDGEGCR